NRRLGRTKPSKTREKRTVGSNTGPIPSRTPMRRHGRAMALSLIDGLVFAFLVVSMTLVRHDLHASLVNVPGILVCSALGLIVALLGRPLAIHRGRCRRPSTGQFGAIV